MVSVGGPESIQSKDGRKLKKQDCMIGDTSGCVKLVLWEQDVGALVEGDSYRIVRVGVRCFSGVKFLSMGKDREIVRVGDIGDVVKE